MNRTYLGLINKGCGGGAYHSVVLTPPPPPPQCFEVSWYNVLKFPTQNGDKLHAQSPLQLEDFTKCNYALGFYQTTKKRHFTAVKERKLTRSKIFGKRRHKSRGPQVAQQLPQPFATGVPITPT